MFCPSTNHVPVLANAYSECVSCVLLAAAAGSFVAAESPLASVRLGTGARVHSVAEVHKREDSCAPFGNRGRIYPASPSRWESWQLPFYSSTVQVFPPALSRPFLPLFPALSLLFPPVSCLQSSRSRLSVRSVTLLRTGLGLMLWQVHWEIFCVHQSDRPVVASPGGGVNYNTGLFISFTVCLLLRLSSCSPASFFFAILSLPVIVSHQLHLFLTHSLSLNPLFAVLPQFWPRALLMISCLVSCSHLVWCTSRVIWSAGQCEKRAHGAFAAPKMTINKKW